MQTVPRKHHLPPGVKPTPLTAVPSEDALRGTKVFDTFLWQRRKDLTRFVQEPRRTETFAQALLHGTRDFAYIAGARAQRLDPVRAH